MKRTSKNVLLKVMADQPRDLSAPILVMGVSACGKSEIAGRLATTLEVPCIEGDALHPPGNIEKMSNGVPLEDEDRWPWLDALAGSVETHSGEQGGAVFSCSALKKAYRQRLRDCVPNLITIYLELDIETAQNRASRRAGHFMPAALVESQFSTLEPPLGEPCTISVDARLPIETVLDHVLRAIPKECDVRGRKQ